MIIMIFKEGKFSFNLVFFDFNHLNQTNHRNNSSDELEILNTTQCLNFDFK